MRRRHIALLRRHGQSELRLLMTGAVSVAELDALLMDAGAELRRIERELSGFNIFEVMRSAHGELRHSNVLAWLLNPRETHGLGDSFLRQWLMRVLHDAQNDVGLGIATIDSALFRSVEVQREWSHIDVLVRIHLDDGEEWAIAIENKVHSGQGTRQLTRYGDRMAASFGNAKRLLMFLRLNEDAPEDDRWTVGTYEQIAEVLRACVEERGNAIGAEPRVFIEHYLTTLRRLMDKQDGKLVELAQQIYERHQRALDFIYAQRTDEESLLSTALAKLMRVSADEHGIVPLSSTKGYIRFIPVAWNTAANRSGTAWGEGKSAYLICELALRNQQPTLKIVEGKAPSEWRQQLHALARSDRGLFKAQAKLPASWMSVYAHKIPNPAEHLEAEEAAAEIWDQCMSHVREDAGFERASKALQAHLAAESLAR